MWYTKNNTFYSRKADVAMSKHYDPAAEAEAYFKELAENKDATDKAYQYIQNTMNATLAQEDTPKLLALIPYIESGEGHLCFKYVGETRRILRALHIIALEDKFQKIPFSSGCNTADELMDKYMLTLFALRRILFKMSDQSVDEAMGFLQDVAPSPFALYVMTNDELLIPSTELYENLLGILADTWTEADIQQFLALINTKR